MQDIYDGLLLLNDLYYDASFDEYQKARQDLEEQVKRELPGFTVAHASEKDTKRITVQSTKLPPQFGTFKQAQRVQQPEALQRELGLSIG